MEENTYIRPVTVQLPGSIALDLLEQGEPLERIMLRGGWQTDSTAMSYLRNWIA